MLYYCLIDVNKDLYVCFNELNNTISVSSPSEDIYNRNAPNVRLVEGKIIFFYVDCVYRLELNTNKVIIKHRKLPYEHSSDFRNITEELYMQATRPWDRYALFCESLTYKPTTTKYKVEYKLEEAAIGRLNKYFPVTKEIKNMNNISDLEKMKLLLYWVSDKVKHNGRLTLPYNRDAISLFEFAREYDYKLNCRGLAILMCELCLASGLKSRYVICSQKEVKYCDSHVVTICYDNALRKWIYLDPCYKMYLFDNTTTLSLQEFKEYMFSGKEIHVNKEANFCGKPLDFDKFKQTMIKKFYKYSSPRQIYIGMDNDRETNLIHLVPDEKDYEDLLCTSDYESFWNEVGGVL